MSLSARSIAACAALALCALPAAALAASKPRATLSDGHIALSTKSATHGKVTFSVKNSGSVEHELVVIKTSTKASKLKVSGNEASEKGSVGEVELDTGKSKNLSLNLKKGHYALICNEPGHYKGGMHVDFTVK
jgi:uncharacterized cupredoxin-like copper-binding protein